MCSPLFNIIIIFGRILSNFYIITILLTVVVYGRLWLIIQGIRFSTRFTIDGVQPKTPPFSTRHLIWVKWKVLSQLFQLIYLLFLYLNSVRHFSVIEFCREQFAYFIFSRFQRKSTYSFFAMDLLAFFNNTHFHIYFSWELTIFWINNIISLSK